MRDAVGPARDFAMPYVLQTEPKFVWERSYVLRARDFAMPYGARLNIQRAGLVYA